MSEGLELEILTAGSTVLRERIKDLFIPAFFGEAGILSHHLPYISLLKTGEISYLDEAGQRHFYLIENGVLQVKENAIVIMADAIESAADMNEGKLKTTMEENERKIKSSFSGQLTPEELKAELDLQRILQMKWEMLKKSRKP